MYIFEELKHFIRSSGYNYILSIILEISEGLFSYFLIHRLIEASTFLFVDGASVT